MKEITEVFKEIYKNPSILNSQSALALFVFIEGFETRRLFGKVETNFYSWLEKETANAFDTKGISPWFSIHRNFSRDVDAFRWFYEILELRGYKEVHEKIIIASDEIYNVDVTFLLEGIFLRPPLYILYESIGYLYSFLNGVEAAVNSIGENAQISPSMEEIRKALKVESVTIPWHREMLMRRCGSETSAFRLAKTLLMPLVDKCKDCNNT